MRAAGTGTAAGITDLGYPQSAAISANGVVVLTALYESLSLYSHGTLTDLPNSRSLVPEGISPNGDIITGVSLSGRAFVYTSGSTWVGYP